MASRALKIDPEKIDESSVASEPLNPSVQSAVPDSADHKEIAILAYQLWQERGCPIGSDQEDWFTAELEFRAHRRHEEEERSMADAEQAASTMLRFPVRSEINQTPGRTALPRRP